MLRTAVRDVYRRLMDAVRALRMRWIGHQIHAEADLDIDGQATLVDTHQLAHAAEHQLTHDVPKLRTAAIHAYPAHREQTTSH